MTTKEAKQRSFKVYSELVRKGQLLSASRLLRALVNGVSYISIGYGDIDWTLGEALCDNKYKFIQIQ